MADATQSGAKSVRVEIYGQVYTIRTESQNDQIHALAEMVDRRMKEIASATSTVDSLKVAILAALHIAEELHETRDRLADYDHELADRSAHCASELDQFIKRYILEPPTE